MTNSTETSEIPKTLPTGYPLRCGICNDMFSKASDVEIHAKNSHGEKALFTCNHPVCGRAFLAQHHLDMHVIRKHKNANKHVCLKPGCGATFSYSTALRRHEQRHDEDVGDSSVAHKRAHAKQYVCSRPGCDAKFAYHASYRRHEQSHDDSDGESSVSSSSSSSEDRPIAGRAKFKCDKCNKSYTRQWNLSIHKLSHPPVEENGSSSVARIQPLVVSLPSPVAPPPSQSDNAHFPVDPLPSQPTNVQFPVAPLPSQPNNAQFPLFPFGSPFQYPMPYFPMGPMGPMGPMPNFAPFSFPLPSGKNASMPRV